jgi:hypothetical protein
MDEIERIGRPTKDKWLAFLRKALELEYITQEEFTERMEIVLQATVMDEVRPAYEDLPWKGWANEWDKLREKGHVLKNGIVPEVVVPAPRRSPLAPYATFLLFLLAAAIGFTLALLIM